jgi:putative transposase
MELEWLKKKLPRSTEVKRAMIETEHPPLSVRRQCELVGLNRAPFYRQPRGETPTNLELMRLIDETYTRTPCYGYRKMTAYLKAQGTANGWRA